MGHVQIILLGCHEVYSICGWPGHTTDGHRILYRDYATSPKKVLIWDPCPLRLPEILTGTRMNMVENCSVFRLLMAASNRSLDCCVTPLPCEPGLLLGFNECT